MSLLSDLIDSIVEMPGEFADVAAQGPVEGVLVLFGALFVTLPVLYFAYLVVGVLVELITPESFGETHP